MDLTARIRELNDAFRTTFAGDGRVYVTAGIAAMSPEQQVEVMRRVHCFIGFTPDIVVGVYMGYDKPRHLGRGATGGHLAAPIAKDFYKMALANKPGVPFAPPPGIKLIRVDPKTGLRAALGQTGTIFEAFKPGTGPSDAAPVIGFGGPDDQQQPQPYRVSPDADRAVRSGGTGGLY